MTPPDETPTIPNLVLPALLFELGLGGVAWAVGLALAHPPHRTLDVSFDGLTAGVLATVPMLVGFFLTWRWPIGLFRGIKERIETLLVPGLRAASIAELALISMAAGLGEELLFRGLIQGVLEGPLGVGGALACASIVFGLAHAVTLGYAVIAALIGAFLGWLWIDTGNLFAPVVCHALYDFVALTVFLRFPR
jgi:CAAX protease family protein